MASKKAERRTKTSLSSDAPPSPLENALIVEQSKASEGAVTYGSCCVPPFTIDFEPFPGNWPPGMVISLDSPQAGSEVHAMTAEVRGFVVRRKDSLETRPRIIEFFKDEAGLWSTPIDLPRPDVVQEGELSIMIEASELNCGFNTVLPSFLSANSGGINLRVVHEPDEFGEERRYTLGRIWFNASGKSSFKRSDAIGLVVINSMGRSGSSLLCRMLDAHPHCVAPQFQGQYGEVAILGHYLRAAAVLSSEGAARNLNRLETEADFETLPAGYLRMDGESAMRLHAKLMGVANNHVVALVRDVHAQIGDYARSIKPDAKFWVEKTWNQTSANLANVLLKDTREIILVRGVQEFWRSQALYLKKINAAEHVIAEHARATYGKYVGIAHSFLDRPEDTLLVRYEDLLADPETEMRRVMAHLRLSFPKEFENFVNATVGASDSHSRSLSTKELEYDGPDFYEYLANMDVAAVNYLKRLLGQLGYTV